MDPLPRIKSTHFADSLNFILQMEGLIASFRCACLAFDAVEIRRIFAEMTELKGETFFAFLQNQTTYNRFRQFNDAVDVFCHRNIDTAGFEWNPAYLVKLSYKTIHAWKILGNEYVEDFCGVSGRLHSKK